MASLSWLTLWSMPTPPFANLEPSPGASGSQAPLRYRPSPLRRLTLGKGQSARRLNAARYMYYPLGGQVDRPVVPAVLMRAIRFGPKIGADFDDEPRWQLR